MARMEDVGAKKANTMDVSETGVDAWTQPLCPYF